MQMTALRLRELLHRVNRANAGLPVPKRICPQPCPAIVTPAMNLTEIYLIALTIIFAVPWLVWPAR